MGFEIRQSRSIVLASGSLRIGHCRGRSDAVAMLSGVTIAPGSTTAMFAINANAVTNPTPLTITAESATTQTISFIVDPAATVNWPGGAQGSPCVTGDFSGDGKTDVACYSGGAGGEWNVGLSTGGGWQTSLWQNRPSPSVAGNCSKGLSMSLPASPVRLETGRWACPPGSGWQTTL